MKQVIVLALIWSMVGAVFASDVSKEAFGQFKVLSVISSKEEWKEFAKSGGGYFVIPSDLTKYLAGTLQEARSLGDHNADKKEGYFEEEKQQHKLQILEKKDWSKFSQKETKTLAQGMNDVAVFILRKTLEALDVPEALWSKATGGLSDSKGLNHFKLVYYDPDKRAPGISWHKDFRWVTVFYFDQPGLQGKIGDEVINVAPKEGHFFVNLGTFFEAFIDNPEILNALTHQVVEQVSAPRVAAGIFCRGAYPNKIYYRLVDNKLVEIDENEVKKYEIKDEKGLFSIAPNSAFSPYYQQDQ
ncbi:MAG TPA: 2OG-Fe(II) oxygenase family protein [Myxococcota bacterium]|nr:2OG-Fe(II) oxygenase family protein [Myxococcota bacterium]